MVWTKNTKNKNGDSFKICSIKHNFIIELEFLFWIADYLKNTTSKYPTITTHESATGGNVSIVTVESYKTNKIAICYLRFEKYYKQILIIIFGKMSSKFRLYFVTHLSVKQRSYGL